MRNIRIVNTPAEIVTTAPAPAAIVIVPEIAPATGEIAITVRAVSPTGEIITSHTWVVAEATTITVIPT